MKIAHKSFSQSIAESLHFSKLKYVTEAEIDQLLEKSNIYIKNQKCSEDKKVSSHKLVDFYGIQSIIDEMGVVHGPYASDVLDLSAVEIPKQIANENYHQGDQSSIYSFTPSIDYADKIDSELNVNFHKNAFDDVKPAAKKQSFRVLSNLRPFRVSRDQVVVSIYNSRITNNLYDSADLALSKHESALLKNFLMRLDEKIYNTEKCTGTLHRLQDDQIPTDEDTVFMKYRYLKNILEWSDKNYKSKTFLNYSLASIDQHPKAYATISSKNNGQRFKFYFLNKIKKIKLQKKSRNYDDSINLSFKSSQLSVPKRNPSRPTTTSFFAISRTSSINSKNSSIISKNTLERIKKNSESKILRRKSLERSRLDLNFVSNKRKTIPISPSMSVGSLASLNNASVSPVNFSALSLPTPTPQALKSTGFKKEKPLIKKLSQKKAKKMFAQKSTENQVQQQYSNEIIKIKDQYIHSPYSVSIPSSTNQTSFISFEYDEPVADNEQSVNSSIRVSESGGIYVPYSYQKTRSQSIIKTGTYFARNADTMPKILSNKEHDPETSFINVYFEDD
ncbi:hypothetical protein QEN19_003310 [Hanseniaspora menglaensis]